MEPDSNTYNMVIYFKKGCKEIEFGGVSYWHTDHPFFTVAFTDGTTYAVAASSIDSFKTTPVGETS